MSTLGACALGAVVGLIGGLVLGLQIGRAALDEADADIRRIQAANRSCESKPLWTSTATREDRE